VEAEAEVEVEDSSPCHLHLKIAACTPKPARAQTPSQRRHCSCCKMQYATELEMEHAKQLVFCQHPVNQVNKIVSRMQRVQICADVDKAVCEHDIRHFPTNMIALLSCYNKRKQNFVKCS
jgi:hypothetical protein